MTIELHGREIHLPGSGHRVPIWFTALSDRKPPNWKYYEGVFESYLCLGRVCKRTRFVKYKILLAASAS